jgi:short-subunit dehydrogenase
MSGMFSSPFQTTYCASKWGLRAFSQALRMEMRTEGIGVTCVLPGTVATDFMKRARSHHAESQRKLSVGMHKVGVSPKRVALKTLRAVRWNFGEQLVGVDAYLVAFVQRFLPGLITFLMNRVYPSAERSLRPAREDESSR